MGRGEGPRREGDRGQAWNHFKSFCANTCVCSGPTLFTQAASTAPSAAGSPPPPVPTPYPRVALPLENKAQPPTLPHHPLLASRPIHVPRTPMPATLGQSLPTPWAICQGDGSFSKKQAHSPPSWPSCLPGFCHTRMEGSCCFGAPWHEGSVRMNGQGRWQCLPGGEVMTHS